VRGYIRKRELTVVTHDGKTYRCGLADRQFAPVTVRLGDRTIARQVRREAVPITHDDMFEAEARLRRAAAASR
jgi:hypothetical protein